MYGRSAESRYMELVGTAQNASKPWPWHPDVHSNGAKLEAWQHVFVPD
jgi:hypothetical protein